MSNSVSSSFSRTTSSHRAFLLACATGAWLVAWMCVRFGFGMQVAAPLRDLALLLVLAVVEEIVFRGGLQRVLLRWLMRAERRGPAPISLANIITSVVFAAAHLWNHPPLVALGVLPISLLLGHAYERANQRLTEPILLHAYFNAVLYTCSWLAVRAAG